MPFAGPLAGDAVPAEMLLKVSPLAPIVVLATLSAVPVVVVSVLTIVVLFWVALTVPPLVAAGPGPVAVTAAFAPVERLSPPVKLIVAPVFELSKMPLAVLETAPLKATVPPVSFWICTGRPPAVEIVPA